MAHNKWLNFRKPFKTLHILTHEQKQKNTNFNTVYTLNIFITATMTVYDELYERLSNVGQEHLLKFWAELTLDQQEVLVRDIDELNLKELKLYFERATASLQENGIKLDDRMQPVPEEKLVSIERTAEERFKAYEKEGMRQISAGHVAVLLMAGGQGKFNYFVI